MSTIHLREWEAGDWVEVHVNGVEVHEGHEVGLVHWKGILRRAGVDVTTEQVAAEEDEDDDEESPETTRAFLEQMMRWPHPLELDERGDEVESLF